MFSMTKIQKCSPIDQHIFIISFVLSVMTTVYLFFFNSTEGQTKRAEERWNCKLHLSVSHTHTHTL